MTPPLIIGPDPVHETTRFTPPLPAGAWGFNVAEVDAADENGNPTVALFAAGILPGRYGDIFGGRVEGAVNIVCIDARTGAAYYRAAGRNGEVPLDLVMEPDPAPASPDMATLESVETYFGIDLRQHLALPSRAAEYTVFLWLDEMTSTPQIVNMPGGAGSSEEEPGPGAAPPADVRYTVAQQVPTSHIPVLYAQGGHARGVIRTAAAGAGGYLTLLGLDFRSRQLRAFSFPSPGGPPSCLVGFEFEPHALFGGDGWLDTPDGPGRAFLIASTPGAISPVVAIEN